MQLLTPLLLAFCCCQSHQLCATVTLSLALKKPAQVRALKEGQEDDKLADGHGQLTRLMPTLQQAQTSVQGSMFETQGMNISPWTESVI